MVLCWYFSLKIILRDCKYLPLCRISSFVKLSPDEQFDDHAASIDQYKDTYLKKNRLLVNILKYLTSWYTKFCI